MDRQPNSPQPLIINPATKQGLDKVNSLINQDGIKCIDTFENQVKELCEIRTPKLKGNESAKQSYFQDYCGGSQPQTLGKWIYYPWNNTINHILDQDDFLQLRTARNIPLISRKDQLRFNQFTVGIIGLSVGNSIALTLAYSGGCNAMKLADPDILEISNLNRLPSNITHLGENKTFITAKQIYEINPYANLILYPEGINANNLSAFFTKEPKIDLVIDECDDVTLKFNLRLAARSLRIPILMATDNGYESNIDLTRFDLKPNAGYMTDVPQVTLADIKEALIIGESLNLAPEEELQLIIQLLGIRNISHDMEIGCIQRIKRNIVSWPQLAMTVFAGGALSTYAVLQLARKQKTKARTSTFSFHTHLQAGYHSKKARKKRKQHKDKFIRFVKSLSR